MTQKCTHLNQIKIKTTDKHVCEECAKTGDKWVHLRMCLVCGKVGCCDSSKNRHATKHFHSTKHPVMRSIERRDLGMLGLSAKSSRRQKGTKAAP